MKEIVFFSNFLGNGGAARVITVLAQGFVEKGHSVTICSFPNKGMEYPYLEKVHYVLMDRPIGNGIKVRLSRIRSIRREIAKHKGAVIISFEYFLNMQTIVASIGLGNKVIVSERNDPAAMGGKFPTSVLRNILYRMCDKLVCQTDDAKAYFPLSIQKKSVVIMNPIKEHLPMKVGGEREHRIVNFCRLEKQKNLPLLIDAFAIFWKDHQEYHLDIYGDGREKKNLEAYIQDSAVKDAVHIYDAIPDIHQQVLNYSMFVSSSDYEGMSNSMIEAMCIGLPTICTDCPCGGARMVIKDGVNGLLVPTGNAQQLAQAMARVADSHELAEQLSQNGVKLRDELSVERILMQWQQCLGDGSNEDIH